ncbi:MAG TPA: S8 family serine peptidase [Roseiflexaceae bacterium]|nr:S8 family serine peptidase [Roseiflexaceae bacterium]
MTRRRRLLSALLLCLAVLVSTGSTTRRAPVLAQPVAPPSDRVTLSAPLSRAQLSLPGSAPTSYMIELRDTPALLTWRAARNAHSLAQANQTALAQGHTIEAAQQQLIPQIASVGGRVLYRLQRTLNGIAVYLPPERVDALRRLPEVRDIRPIIMKTIDHTSSVPLIGAPELWGGSSALHGEGVKIGVIDTGIDYLHTDFGGSGLASDYSRNDTTVITDQVGFPNAKVVGGFDFAGDDYDPSTLENFFPFPDEDPADCQGHGSHVAGTIGGYGVNANGASYAGPWDATHVPTATMRIGPGVAPKADLYALRVFGCSGPTGLTAWALEWATDPNGDYEFDDHLDIVNMSLGSAFGPPGQDFEVDVANNAALTGVIVVASAGNSGDTFFNVGDPSTADWAISVASSLDRGAITGAMRVNTPPAIAGLYPANEAEFGPDMARTGALTGAVAYPGGGQGNGCAEFSAANATVLRGKIALVDRGACSLKSKVLHAQQAGAIGTLVANAVPGFPSAMGDDPSITTPITIPSMLTTQAAGDAIKLHLADPGGVNITLTSAYRDTRRNVDDQLVDSLSTFSSRGPRRVDAALKPDIAAPGDTIFSAASGTGTRGVSFSGTSMAAPHVAGSMALLRQLHPDWSVEELKALLMNTAGVRARLGGQTGPLYSPSRQGAGRVTLPAASQAMAVAYNADNPGQVSISFGMPQVLDTTSAVKNVRVVNKRDTAASYAIGVTDVVTTSGVTIQPLAASVQVPAHGSATFAVLMTVDATKLDHSLDPATAATQDGLARQFLGEHSGYVTLTGPDALRVPFYVAPRPASAMHAAGPLHFGLNTTSATLSLRGNDVDTPAFRSRAWALQLQEQQVNDIYTGGSQDAGDLKYIGVGSDVAQPGGFTKDTQIYFGVATFGAWSTPVGYDSQFLVLIDTNGDQFAEYLIYTLNASQAGGANDASDVFVSVVVDLNKDKIIATHPLAAQFNSSVMVLSAKAGEFGLTSGKSRFRYSMVAFQRENSYSGDYTATYSFDPAAPALSLGGVPAIDDLNGASAMVRVNRASWIVDAPQGLLLLHELNGILAQSELVPVAVELHRQFMPVAARLTQRVQ